MKNLKRLLALASAMALAVSLTACGPNGGASNPSNPAPSSTSSGQSQMRPNPTLKFLRSSSPGMKMGSKLPVPC